MSKLQVHPFQRGLIQGFYLDSEKYFANVARTRSPEIVPGFGFRVYRLPDLSMSPSRKCKCENIYGLTLSTCTHCLASLHPLLGAFFRASLSLSGLPGMELICLVKPEPSRELVTEQLFCPDDSGDSVGPAAKNRQLCTNWHKCCLLLTKNSTEARLHRPRSMCWMSSRETSSGSSSPNLGALKPSASGGCAPHFSSKQRKILTQTSPEGVAKRLQV